MTWTSDCGRGQVVPAKSGWHALVDGVALRRPRGRGAVRFPTKGSAQFAVVEFLSTGAFTPPAFPQHVYKTYDPEAEGYGSADQWRAVFAGLFAPLKDDEPFQVLGIPASSTWDQIKTAYRRLAASTHPDRGGSSEAFCRVREAFEVLKNRAAAV
jgi:hypothetical protein